MHVQIKLVITFDCWSHLTVDGVAVVAEIGETMTCSFSPLTKL